MKKLGKYEIIKELGRGAMGVVYLAHDPLIDRQVALKTITAGLAENPELLDRFYREARAAGKLNHLNIVTIFELGEENKTPYIAMEFLEGESIEHLISQRREMPLVQKIGYFIQVCRGLGYAHQRGVVHRDIKPANIVLTTDDVIKVVDFGIARVMAASKTQTGMMMGTVAYMSPEQVRGDHVDGRTDIWSVGVTFQEFITGQRPFTADNIAAVMFNIVTQEPKPISSFIPDSPPELDAIMARVFKKQAAERYANLEDLLAELEPVHRKLQQSGVTQIVLQGKQLLEQGEYQRARDLLRSAVLLDTGNREAKTLLEKATEELQRSGILPELSEKVALAENLFNQGKVAEASEQVESALKLDSKFGPAVELMEKIRAQADRERAISQMMQTAIQQRDEGNLTAAETQLEKLLSQFGDNPQAAQLKKQISEERQGREQRKHFSGQLQRARGLWTDQKYKECIDILIDLQKDFPAEKEIQNLLDTARADLEEQTRRERQQERDRKVADARKMLSEQKFAESLEVLDMLLQADPNDSVVQRLRDRVLVERKEHAKRIRIQHEQQAVKKLLSESKSQEAADRAEALLKEFPEEVDVKQLAELARSQWQKEQQKQLLQAKLAEIRGLMERGEFEQAVATAGQALETFRGNKELQDLRRDAETKAKEKKEQEEREFIAKQLQAMGEAISKDELTAAIDLGNKTIVRVGHNTEVTRMLNLAQTKQQQRQQAENQLKTAYYKWSEGKLEEADQILADAQKTQIFNPQIHNLREMLKDKKPPPPAQTVFGQIGFGVPVSEEPAAPPKTPADDQGTVVRPLGAVPGVPTAEGTTVMPAGVIPGGIPPAAPPKEDKEKQKEEVKATPPVAEPKKPEKDKKKKGKEVEKEQFDSTVKMVEPPKAKSPAAEAAPPSAPPKDVKKESAPAAPTAEKIKEEKKPEKAAGSAAPTAPKVEEKKPEKAPPPPARPEPKPASREAAPATRTAKAEADVIAPPVAVPAPEKSNTGMIFGGIGAVVVLGIALVVWAPWKDKTPPDPDTQPKAEVSKPSPDSGAGKAPETGGGKIVPPGPTPDSEQQTLISKARQAIGQMDFKNARRWLDDAGKIKGGPLGAEIAKAKASLDAAIKQQGLIARANQSVNKEDFKGAYKLLDDAEKIPDGPLGGEIAKLRKNFEIAEKDTATRAKLRRQTDFINAGDAKRSNRDDLRSQRDAAEEYRKAIAEDGPRNDEAQTRLNEVNGRITELEKIPALRDRVKQALGREDFATARQSAQEANTISETDGRAMLGDVNTAERNKAAELQRQFDQASRNNNSSALDQLNNEVQRYKGLPTGTLGEKARELEGKIPGEKTAIAERTKPPKPPDSEPAPAVARRYSATPIVLSYKAYTEPGLRDGATVDPRHIQGGLKAISTTISEDIRRKASAGEVGLILKIGSDGQVIDAQVDRQVRDTSGVGAAVASEAKNWKFGPFEVNGKKVVVNVPFTVKFD